MKDGTALTLGRFAEINGNVSRALPRALEKVMRDLHDVGPKDLVRYSQDGLRLSGVLAEAFKNLYMGHVSTATFTASPIDCDAEPSRPHGWAIEKHHKAGRFYWDPSKIKLQEIGSRLTPHGVHELWKRMVNAGALNANVLEFLLTHQDYIPEEWKELVGVVFIGTLYRYGEHIFARRLHWEGRWMTDTFHVLFLRDMPPERSKDQFTAIAA